MLWVVSLQLVTGFKWTELLRGVELYENCPNLTRLDDFFEVKVAGLASAWGGAPGGDGPNKRLASGMPDCGCDVSRLSCLNSRERGFLRKLQRFRSGVLYRKVLLEFFAGKHVAEIATRSLHRHFRPVAGSSPYPRSES